MKDIKNDSPIINSPEFRFYRLIEDLHNKKDTDNVKKFKSLIDRRDVILIKMLEFSKNEISPIN